MLLLLRQFLPTHLSRKLRDLYEFVFIDRLAASMVILFEPVYLYQLGYGIAGVLWYFFLVYLLYLFVVPLGSKFIARFGYQRSLFLSSFAFMGYYGSLLLAKSSLWFLLLAACILTVRKSLYWQALNYDSARDGQDDEEGREVSSRKVIEIAVAALGPLLGGMVLEQYGFASLFMLAGCVMLFANVPLFMHWELHQPHTFSYLGAFRRLAEKTKRRFVFGIAATAEEVTHLTLWPVFLYLFFLGEFSLLGGVVATTTLIGALLLFVVGRVTDASSPSRALRFMTGLYSLSWFVRPFVATTAMAATTDLFARWTRNMLQVPFMTIVYDRARHHQHILESTALYSMSIAIGKLSFVSVLLAIFYTFTSDVAWLVVFGLTGVVTWFYLLLAKEATH